MKRFIEAQNPVYETVKKELTNGKKETHWMWFIFPQIEGLGRSYIAKLFSLKKDEVKEYLDNELLYSRLVECTELIENIDDVEYTFGPVDAMKLKSSLTLFGVVSENPIFNRVLDKLFTDRCEFTISALA